MTNWGGRGTVTADFVGLRCFLEREVPPCFESRKKELAPDSRQAFGEDLNAEAGEERRRDAPIAKLPSFSETESVQNMTF